MVKKIRDQIKVKGLGAKAYDSNDFLSTEEASAFLGLSKGNRNSLYYWKRRVAPDSTFPKLGRHTMWPVSFLQDVFKYRNVG